jgi:hypothetical protein
MLIQLKFAPFTKADALDLLSNMAGWLLCQHGLRRGTPAQEDVKRCYLEAYQELYGPGDQSIGIPVAFRRKP